MVPPQRLLERLLFGIGRDETRRLLALLHEPDHPDGRITPIWCVQSPFYDIAGPIRRVFRCRHIVLRRMALKGIDQFFPMFSGEAKTTEERRFTFPIRVGKREQVRDYFAFRHNGLFVMGQFHTYPPLRWELRPVKDSIARFGE